VMRGATNRNVNKIRGYALKLESRLIRDGSNMVRCDRCTDVQLHGMDTTAGEFDTSQTIAIDHCKFLRSGAISLIGYFPSGISAANCVTTRTFISASGCDDLSYIAPKFVGTNVTGAVPTLAAMEFSGTNNRVSIIGENYNWNPGSKPLYSGLPTSADTLSGIINVRKTADQLLAGASAQSVTDLSFAIGANETWTFRCVLFTNNTASDTGGCKVAVNGPAGSTIKALAFGPVAVPGATQTTTSSLLTALATLSAQAFTTVAVTPGWVQIEGTMVNGATAGTFQIQAAEGTAADDITIQANSTLDANRV
jgi:hypothetical protein